MWTGPVAIRGKNGCEIDLVVEAARHIHAIEIKSARSPDDSLAKNMDRFAKSVAPLSSKTVVYAGGAWPIAGGGRFVNFRGLAALLDEIAGSATAHF